MKTLPDPSAPLPETVHMEAHPATVKHTGFIRIVKAGGYSVQGLRWAFTGEAAFRQECLLALVTLPVAVLLPIGMMERMLVVCITCLVLIVELLNSAVEAVVDRVGLEAHPLSGKAKDIGSAAVLVTLVLLGYVWLEVLFSLF